MNRFIVADSTKCIGCRTCEVACVVSHQETEDCASVSPKAFTSRIRVVKGGSFTTAVGCHQCEDAPCANVCPTNAIRRAAGFWQVEQARCIGCKSCMVACPFGAMQVRRVGNNTQALKCDLCAHRESGPACVEACPTHALRCVDPARLRAERLHHLV
ncbi:4Fe-4S binding protein [Enterobacter oligotrophicus]|uniref:4Fe-4S binding protein n=1 Tax=Enterobacter oligotrophicus TaxID=2478464 RepID=UPI0023F51FD8|nr:4Fe-4S binding protein [Enterobacter oligotrophicus]